MIIDEANMTADTSCLSLLQIGPDRLGCKGSMMSV
jgi:hypothetical protein